MILNQKRRVHDRVTAAIRERLGVTDAPDFAIEVPPTRALGDLAVTVAFQLARSLRKRRAPSRRTCSRRSATFPASPAWSRRRTAI